MSKIKELAAKLVAGEITEDDFVSQHESSFIGREVAAEDETIRKRAQGMVLGPLQTKSKRIVKKVSEALGEPVLPEEELSEMSAQDIIEALAEPLTTKVRGLVDLSKNSDKPNKELAAKNTELETKMLGLQADLKTAQEMVGTWETKYNEAQSEFTNKEKQRTLKEKVRAIKDKLPWSVDLMGTEEGQLQREALDNRFENSYGYELDENMTSTGGLRIFKKDDPEKKPIRNEEKYTTLDELAATHYKKLLKANPNKPNGTKKPETPISRDKPEEKDNNDPYVAKPRKGETF